MMEFLQYFGVEQGLVAKVSLFTRPCLACRLQIIIAVNHSGR